MRWFAALFVCALCLAPAGRIAADPPAPPEPMSLVQAVDAVLAAHAAKDEARLADLGAKDDPDPWMVADEVHRRGNTEAAVAFARAAPRPDVARLAEFLTGRSPKPTDEAVRAAITAWSEARRAKEPAKALAALDAVTPPEDGLLLTRWGYARGYALRAVERHPESSIAFEACAKAAASVGWLALAGDALQEAGVSAFRASDFPRSVALWERRVAQERERGHDDTLAFALQDLAVGQGRVGQLAKAVEGSEAALAIFERLGLEGEVAVALGNLGTLYFHHGDYARALRTQERALALAERLGDKLGVAYALTNLGQVHGMRGDHSAAVPVLERALAINREVGDVEGEISALELLGGVRRDLGDLLTSRSLHEQALAAAEATKRPHLLASALGSLAGIFASLGEFDRALDAYRRSMEVTDAIGLTRDSADSLSGLARVQFRMGLLNESQANHERALRMYEAFGAQNGVIRSLTNLGAVHLKRGELDKARVHFERVLQLAEESGHFESTISCRLMIANVQAGFGDFPKAIETSMRALADAEKAGTLSLRQTAWGNIAIYRLATGDDAGAITAAHKAVEDAWLLVRGQTEEHQAMARMQVALVEPVGAIAAARLGDVATAAYFLERGRAGALLESLGGREAVRAVALPEPLRQAEIEARDSERLASRRYRTALAAGDDDAAAPALAAEQTRARAALKDVLEKIEREAKAAAHVTQPKPDALAKIQSRLAQGETLVLYLTGENELYNPEALALVATKTAARIVRLGAPQEIDQAAELAVVTGPGHDITGPAETLRRRLVAPLALGPETKRLIVSPSGTLAYVPFAVLTDLPLCYVPSGSVLGALQADGALRGSGVLALGDPQYASSKRSEARGLDLAALPGTREEARAVGDLVLLGADATPTKFVAALAMRPRWRAVHLACHGLVDPDRPLLSRLALTPDETSDGFLTALDVLRLRIPADLTVLSACETGKGKVVSGEGVLGLTRAFMYAGAPRVLVSLWRVDDEATRLLMQTFHAGWKGGKLGAAAALRAAQDAVKNHETETIDKEASRTAGRDVRTKTKPYVHPWYWAGWALWGLPE